MPSFIFIQVCAGEDENYAGDIMQIIFLPFSKASECRPLFLLQFVRMEDDDVAGEKGTIQILSLPFSKDVYECRPLLLFQYLEAKMKMLLGIRILSKLFFYPFRKHPNVILYFCYSSTFVERRIRMSSFIFVPVCGGEDEDVAVAGDLNIIRNFDTLFERRIRMSSSIFVPVCGGEDEDVAGAGDINIIQSLFYPFRKTYPNVVFYFCFNLWRGR